VTWLTCAMIDRSVAPILQQPCSNTRVIGAVTIQERISRPGQGSCRPTPIAVMLRPALCCGGPGAAGLPGFSRNIISASQGYRPFRNVIRDRQTVQEGGTTSGSPPSSPGSRATMTSPRPQLHAPALACLHPVPRRR